MLGRNGEESIPMLMMNHTDKEESTPGMPPRSRPNASEVKNTPRLVEITSNPGTPLKVTEISGQYICAHFPLHSRGMVKLNPRFGVYSIYIHNRNVILSHRTAQRKKSYNSDVYIFIFIKVCIVLDVVTGFTPQQGTSPSPSGTSFCTVLNAIYNLIGYFVIYVYLYALCSLLYQHSLTCVRIYYSSLPSAVSILYNNLFFTDLAEKVLELHIKWQSFK